MESVIATVAPLVPTAAWPIIIVVLGCAFIYYKIKSERKATKETRDKDAEEMKTEIALLKNEVEQIKALDLASKLAQIQTDLSWIKEKLKCVRS